MKKKLSIKERAVLLDVLPQRHNYKTIKAVREFIEKELHFNGEECHKYSIETIEFPNGAKQLRFDDQASANYLKDVKLDPLVAAAIVERLRELDKDKQVSADHLTLWEKFIG